MKKILTAFIVIFFNITMASPGFASPPVKAKLEPRSLSFSSTSLVFSVIQGRTTPNKTSTLSANRGTPNVWLAKSANSNWLVLPAAARGLLSFGINASGLAVGTYTSTVTASAWGYESATLQVTLTVTVPPVLSFSSTSLSFSVVQNSTTGNKTSTLSANTGTPTVTLAKSANSNWLILPASALGSLSFGINASGLSPGTYSSTVTASATDYASATLQVNLTVTVPPALSFSPTSLSFSVVQNGNTGNKTSTLSANTGTPTVTLTKSANSNWLVLPSAALGSLSFGIDASGLAVGTYTTTVSASAAGYADATLQVTLIVTEPPALSFSPTSLSFSVVQNGTTTNKTSTLSANTGTPTVMLTKSANSNWLVLPSAAVGSLSFGINASGLAVGTYTSTVSASAAGYADGILQVTLTVTVSPALSFSPTSLSFSVVQNGSTTNKTSTLSANTGTPTVTLTKSANSNWLVLPSAAIGSLSFGINSSGLASGTYISMVTASSAGYTDATLQVTLTVTVSPALSFSPASLSFSVVQNGSTANKTSTLSANTGTPTVTLTQSINSNWLVLPSAAIGLLSFGINSSGLASGTYISTVTASSAGYTDATLQVTLTVTETFVLSFSPASLSFSVIQNGATANKTSTLSANTGTPTVVLTKSANSNWLVLPSAALGSLSFGINTSGLAVGTYTSTVSASSSGYTSATLHLTLTVTASSAQWVSKANALRKRSEVSSVVYNGKLYAFLGFRDSALNVEPSAEVYDPVSNTWTLLNSIPLNKAVTHQGVVLIDDNVWHIGGRVGQNPGPLTSEIWIYNITSNSWSPGPQIKDPATGNALLWGGGGAALLGRTLHIFGGFIINACNNDQGTYHLTLNVDDWLASPTQAAPWKNELAPLPVKRNHCGTVVLGGKIYAIGGQLGHDCGGGQDRQYSHMYNPATNTWTELPLLPISRSHAEGSIFSIDGKIYLVAGQGPNSICTNKVTIFDPAGNNGAGSWADDINLTLPKSYEGLSSKVINTTFIISHGGEGSSKATRNTTYSRTLSRSPVYKLGFPSECANLHVLSGNSVKAKTLLFTIDGSKDYTISSNANWLSITKNVSGTAITNSVDVEYTASSAGLAAGNYSATITATGTGSSPDYTSASYCINLTVYSTAPVAGILEAELALLNKVVVASNYSGFTGTGFADYINSTGDFIEWTLNKTSPGEVSLNFRYANGSIADRPLKLEVNGMVVAASLAFPPTNGFAIWSTTSYTTNLVSGANKIKLTAIGSSGANIDHLAWNDVSSSLSAPLKNISIVPTDLTASIVSSNFRASVVPNPVSGNAKLLVKTSSELPVEIILIDILGKVHKNLSVKNRMAGYLDFSVNELPSGLYFIIVKQGKERATARFVIEK